MSSYECDFCLDPLPEYPLNVKFTDCVELKFCCETCRDGWCKEYYAMTASSHTDDIVDKIYEEMIDG